jgi:hypothetical protein
MCRKLYLVGSCFLHRLAFQGCMYENQTYSHKNRNLYKAYDKLLGADQYFEQLYSKHLKTYYKGRATKRFLRLTKK